MHTGIRKSFSNEVVTGSEIRAVHTAPFRTADFIYQRKFERSIPIRSRIKARGVDVVAEADGKLFVIEARAEDQSIHQFAVGQFVCQTSPGADLEGLVVAAAVAEQEFEGVTCIYLPGWSLEEGYQAGHEAELLSRHKFTACMEGEFAVQRDVGVVERLIGTIQVAERTAEIEVVVFVEHAKPQCACGEVYEREVWVVDWFRRDVGIELAIAVVLAGPLQVRAVYAALADTQISAKYEVMGFFAIATHFFGIRSGQAPLQGCKFGSARFIAPKRAAYTEIVITANRNFLVVRSRVRIVSVIFQDRRPLVAVISHNAVVAIHHTRHSRVQIERALVKLREVDVLCLHCHCRQHHEAQRKNV